MELMPTPLFTSCPLDNCLLLKTHSHVSAGPDGAGVTERFTVQGYQTEQEACALAAKALNDRHQGTMAPQFSMPTQDYVVDLQPDVTLRVARFDVRTFSSPSTVRIHSIHSVASIHVPM